jgi:hypothetical protein
MERRHPVDIARLALTLLGGALLPAAAAAESSREVTVGGGTIDVTITGTPAVPEPALLGWVEQSARGVTSYLGRFPVPRVRLEVWTGGRGGIGGVTRGGSLPSIRVRLAAGVDERALERDWVLTHEMLHLGFPNLTTDDSWAEEGLSTYAEPIARARVGLVREQGIWSDLIDGLPKGLPRRGDPGLHGTQDWGRTYWGGALFWLTADLRIREQTRNRRGLPDALAAILAAGGDIRARWTLARTLATGDRALGLTVLTDLYREHGTRATDVDLDALWRRLGVRRAGGRVVFEDDAALASARRAIDGSAAGPAAGDLPLGLRAVRVALQGRPELRHPHDHRLLQQVGDDGRRRGRPAGEVLDEHHGGDGPRAQQHGRPPVEG